MTVDGKKVETYGIDKGFLAFDMKAGKHTVTMTYTPAGWTVGVIISAIALAVLLGFIAVDAVKFFKKRAAARRERAAAEAAAAEALIAEGDPILRAALAENAADSEKKGAPYHVPTPIQRTSTASADTAIPTDDAPIADATVAPEGESAGDDAPVADADTDAPTLASPVQGEVAPPQAETEGLSSPEETTPTEE